MPVAIDKRQCLDRLRAHVEDELARATAGQRRVQAGATHEEARAENDKDTRALEATYLARGLAERVVTLERTRVALARLAVRDFGPGDPIAMSALVTLEDVDSGELRSYFITPAAGGERLEVEGATVQTVTPEAPLGRALVGASVGDELRVPAPRGARAMEIVAVA